VKGKGRKRRSWRSFTRVWKATCPLCGNVETNATARCPIDESPLVVAFEVHKWLINSLPIHTAHVRCEGDCGYSSSAVMCPHDGTPITGSYLEFRPPLHRIITVNIINTIYAAITLYALWFVVSINLKGGMKAKDANIVINLFLYWFIPLGVVAFILNSFGVINSLLSWLPFRFWFDFDQAERHAETIAALDELDREERRK